MVPVLASLRLNTTVAVAAQRLMELNLDTLPVLDESGKVTGFVTEQDVMTAMLDAHGGDQPIANCNHFSVAVFEDNVAAEEIATFFSRSAVQRVVIIRQGAPVGLVSRRTLLRWLLNHSLDRQSESRAGSGTGPLPPSRFVESIHELAAAVSRLTKLDADDCEELLSSSVVSEATRIQESVENLLISCRPRRMPARTNEQLATGAMSIA
jgi:signal-transduction protein with cAMP-binding, CBS, and nucleotidyltransferase domain